MPDGDPFKEAVRRIIKDEIAKLQQVITGAQGNVQGTVSAINDDGTVDVDTIDGTLQEVGTPIVRTLGEQVIVVTSLEGMQVAL